MWARVADINMIFYVLMLLVIMVTKCQNLFYKGPIPGGSVHMCNYRQNGLNLFLMTCFDVFKYTYVSPL